MKTIKELEQSIQRHKILYYQGRPEISDAEYDKLEEALRKIDPENVILQSVGAQPVSGQKVTHKTKMLSLAKTYSIEELKKWMKDIESVSMFKLDGVSCSLVYEDGRLSLAKTRGDGSQGEVITEKVIWVQNIPREIELKGEVEIRGELYCEESDFIGLAEEMESIGLNRPSNQRNIVAGLMGRKEHFYLAKHIKFQAFEILVAESRFQKESDKFYFLKKQHFEIPDIVVHNDDSKLKEVIDEAQEFMSKGEYQIDGLVFVYNDIGLQNDLGETSHHPRYKMAYKFQGDTKTTEVERIEWQVSRNGTLTPVAKVKKVELSGAMISSVTLHNYGMVRQFNIKKGDHIEIVRSGEVIPKFLNVIKEAKGDFEAPGECPSCQSELIVEDIRLKCINPECPAQIKETILNYMKKIGIEDISSKRLDEMIKKKLVTRISDLYRLSGDDFYKLDKVKDKLANKLYQNIQNTKDQQLDRLLGAIGISGGAQTKCQKLVNEGFDSLEKLEALSLEDLIEVEGFAEKSASEFYQSFKQKLPIIKELVSLGMTFKEKEKRESKISGLKICITGALSEKRSVIEERIRDHGGSTLGSVSKKTDILVTNEQSSDSKKFVKAKELGIKIISEQELKDLIG